jgi:hypothetical protein
VTNINAAAAGRNTATLEPRRKHPAGTTPKARPVASQTAQPATNERIVRLLEEVKAQLADSKKREQQIARDLTRLLKRK